jgi:hypothetical protein
MENRVERPLTLSEIQTGLQDIVRLAESPETDRYRFQDFRECLDYLRTVVLYLKFDVEATRRERADLEKLNGEGKQE